MKKFFKNTLISFLIIFFLLSIINLVAQIIQHYFVITPQIIELAESVKNVGISAEESYQMLASVYSAGYGDKIQIQIMILIISILLSLAIGLIYTFEKKSKIKIIICYILGIIIVPISVTMFNVFNYLEVSTIEFFTEFLYYFKKINIWYTLIFIILYLIKFLVNKKKTKEMNNILKNKKKSN